MRISALIPTYNRRGYVQRAIKSVLAQTLRVDEIIVVDDGSTDGTAEQIATEFQDQVRVVRQTNQGVSGARKRAIAEASGDWVAFLDSDDEWTPERNQIFARAIAGVPAEVAWIFGNTLEITDAGAEMTQYGKLGLTVAEPVHVFEDSLSVQYPWQFGLLQSSVIKREVLLELKCFSDNLRYTEDRLAGFQVACRYKFAAVPESVTKWYRTSDLSGSSLAFAMNSMADNDLCIDYRLAAMKAFSLAAESVRRQPWGELYAENVRGLCIERFRKGTSSRQISLQQFRYGVSCKSVAFFCAAMLGRTGIGLWRKAAAKGRATSSEIRGTTEVPANGR